MTVKHETKRKRNNIFYAIVCAVLMCVIFLSMIGYFYTTVEDDASEQLHIQTKQIKDDLILQIKSDRENLATMAHLAAELYSDGKDYSFILETFEPIGLIGDLRILTPDNILITKNGTYDLNGTVDFNAELEKDKHTTGRVSDLTRENHEVVRSAVPITVKGKTVGILYGIIELDVLADKYNNMAKELDAQLFVYDKDTGKLVIDTIHENLGNISFMKDRKYHKGYSYEAMMATENGFTSFVSAYNGEDLYVHYSTIDDLEWRISLARYESQVFAKAHTIAQILFASFFCIVLIMALYFLINITNEKRNAAVATAASLVRKLLLEINQCQDNITAALKQICSFANARSTIFFNTDDKDFSYVPPAHLLLGDDRTFFKSELLRYADNLYKSNHTPVSLMSIITNHHLKESNKPLYDFLKKHDIREISFVAIADEYNHISILGATNPSRSKATRLLLDDVAVCFSIALYNKTYLNKTELAATTDSLTGVLNRVAYNRDIVAFNRENPHNFACIYIDVNELHLRNNKYGHAAGDEMLICIANTLKKIFYGHKVYRMGGDEFLVFTTGISPEVINKNLDLLVEELAEKTYRVAIGVSYRTRNINTVEMLHEAEKRMYEAKAHYYQSKESLSSKKEDETSYVQLRTGIREIDTLLSVLNEHYNGIYRVSLSSDSAHRILMPAYLGYNEDEDHFSALLNKYIAETVDSDHRRSIMSFLNYDALKKQFADGNTPKISYKKTNGETVILTVYKLDKNELESDNTLWVFSKA